MANVIITIKIMPADTDTDLEALEQKILAIIKQLTGETETRTVIEPVAFGLKSLKITYVTDEKKGSTEPVEKAIAELEEVNSAEVVDVRRAVG